VNCGAVNTVRVRQRSPAGGCCCRLRRATSITEAWHRRRSSNTAACNLLSHHVYTHYNTPLSSASYVDCKRGTTRICSCAPRCGAVVQQSDYTSCPPGPQQQTCSTLQRVNEADRTCRRRDTVPLHRPCQKTFTTHTVSGRQGIK